MKIGVDVDGVLTDIERYLWDYGSKYYYRLNKEINIDHNKYNSLDMFDWGEQADDMFWCENYDTYCQNAEARVFAAEIIKQLIKEGHEIYIITARGGRCENKKTKRKSDKILKKWLKKHKIKYNKIFTPGEDKLCTCLENDIDIMIEDCPDNLKQLSKHMPMICMHASYNAKCRGKNITRCHSWYEIYDKINRIF